MGVQKGEPKPYVAMLPALTAEELAELQIALEERMYSLQAEIDHRRLVCAALLTAVREAMYGVSGGGSYPPDSEEEGE